MTVETRTPRNQALTSLVESYRFWDVAALWARDRLEHEEIVARALAQGIIRDGLMFQSIDPRWLKGDDQRLELKGYPYVGYRAMPAGPTAVLRVEALQHLLAIVQAAQTPSHELLAEEFVTREDFRCWLVNREIALPNFWFPALMSSGL
jgi:hypothetical protein